MVAVLPTKWGFAENQRVGKISGGGPKKLISRLFFSSEAVGRFV
jgi:hypothetical protein